MKYYKIFPLLLIFFNEIFSFYSQIANFFYLDHKNKYLFY